MNNNDIKRLKEMIDSSKKIVVFTGAGISVPSGIPDFRSSNGLYSTEYEGLSPEEIISHSFFMRNPKLFYKFYFDKMIFKDAQPNLAHKYFAKIGAIIVTQNIDNLHTLAGSKTVYELHGNVYRNYCMKCHKFYDLKDINTTGVPYCDCGGIIKPDVVLYEEGLDGDTITGAIRSISEADMLIIVGTSLRVYPAAGFINYYRGNKLVVLNKEKTPFDGGANLAIYGDIVDIIKELEEK